MNLLKPYYDLLASILVTDFIVIASMISFQAVSLYHLPVKHSPEARIKFGEYQKMLFSGSVFQFSIYEIPMVAGCR